MEGHRSLIHALAVDEQAQGQGVGRYLFEEALGLTLQLSRSGPVAFRLFVTDAIDETAARFYEHFGFSRLVEDFPCRMVFDLKPLLSAPRKTPPGAGELDSGHTDTASRAEELLRRVGFRPGPLVVAVQRHHPTKPGGSVSQGSRGPLRSKAGPVIGERSLTNKIHASQELCQRTFAILAPR